MARGFAAFLRRSLAAYLACALALHALVGPLVQAVVAQDDGRVLTAICAGGKIQFVVIDLSGDTPPEILDQSAEDPIDQPEIAFEIDCPTVAGKAGIVPASVALTGPVPICREQFVRPSTDDGAPATFCVRPPARGPPTLS